LRVHSGQACEDAKNQGESLSMNLAQPNLFTQWAKQHQAMAGRLVID
jgi:hypothetical protein